jgi:hypothetical protein
MAKVSLIRLTLSASALSLIFQRMDDLTLYLIEVLIN